MLDVSKAEGIVDLSLRPRLIEPALEVSRPIGKKRKAVPVDPGKPAVRLLAQFMLVDMCSLFESWYLSLPPRP